MNIRIATATDLDQILEMEQILTREKLRQRIQETETGKARYLVAAEGAKIAGHVFLKFYGKKTAPTYPDFEDLYIHPDFRHRGIGETLVIACEKVAKEAGATRIGIAANPDERCPARKLYQKLGYSVANPEPYVGGEYNGVKDWVVDLVKELPSDIDRIDESAGQ